MSTKKRVEKKPVKTRFNIEKVENGYTVDVSEESEDSYRSKTHIFYCADEVIDFLMDELED